MGGPESNRRRDFMASPKTDFVSDALAVSSARKGIAGSSEQYPTRAEPTRACGKLKPSEEKFRGMVDAIPTFAWCALPVGSVEFFNQRGHDNTGTSQLEHRHSGW